MQAPSSAGESLVEGTSSVEAPPAASTGLDPAQQAEAPPVVFPGQVPTFASAGAPTSTSGPGAPSVASSPPQAPAPSSTPTQAPAPSSSSPGAPPSSVAPSPSTPSAHQSSADVQSSGSRTGAFDSSHITVPVPIALLTQEQANALLIASGHHQLGAPAEQTSGAGAAAPNFSPTSTAAPGSSPGLPDS